MEYVYYDYNNSKIWDYDVESNNCTSMTLTKNTVPAYYIAQFLAGNTSFY